ncbi:hypothetical protein EV683_1196 [Crenobacter luteus]|uniref:DUF469 domain-containing protein n=1 Tax=Crenobacter luteus TaxID=1452487 RepID=A0A161SES9_9NEIS|nr:50S ribosome-binding protein YggL [Crenobacter luteus]KZE30275.1 hypothetical protein AVW16_12830 [Crenobacter luteus]TCP10728.1 hypothetical protein EV683_1196 [Crenobacter luteus]
MPRNPQSRQRLKRLSPRRQKKQRVGAYTQLGFALEAALHAVPPAAEDAFLDAWLSAVDEQGVSFGGSFDAGSPSLLSGMVFPVSNKPVDEEMRETLIAWLTQRPEVARVAAGELADVWHSE